MISKYEERYQGFGPTLAAEKLKGLGLVVDHDTLRQWLMEKGLWQKRRRRAKHRSWRPRRGHFGELVQMDGSPHEWFEKRGQKCCLMNMVDDATSKFAVEPREKSDYHKSAKGYDLKAIFCIEEQRSLTKDWIVRFENNYYQIQRKTSVPTAVQQVKVRRYLDGGLQSTTEAKT